MTKIDLDANPISSILDTDLYKLTMMQAICQMYPWMMAEYTWINRGNIKFPEGFGEHLERRINLLAALYLTDDEKKYLTGTCYYMNPVFLSCLGCYQFDSKEVSIRQKGTDLLIQISGYWFQTVLWETHLMATISELYYEMTIPPKKRPQEEEAFEQAREKGLKLAEAGVYFADFGARRRFSQKIHEAVVRGLMDGGKEYMTGTSDVYLSMKFGLTPIGTQAHEWFMFHAAYFGVRGANYMALKKWKDVYRGNLGIALTDTFTTDVFFADHDTEMTKLFDGLRWDSGDPYLFTYKAIDHYKRKKVDPRTKIIVYSDGLTTDRCIELHRHFDGMIIDRYGVGTHFTNDWSHKGIDPLNMVIKLTACKEEQDSNWLPCVKLSDVNGKWTGDVSAILRYQSELGL